MSSYTNFQSGETLTANKLNEAFGLIDSKIDLVLPAAQEAVEKATEAAETAADLVDEVAEMAQQVQDKAGKDYVDDGDADTEARAKAYTDIREEAISSAYTAADADVLTAAKTYADNQASAALSAATTYTDEEIDAVETDYAAADATTLADAKDYTDDREVAITTAYTAADSTVLNTSQTYTDNKVAGMVAPHWRTPQALNVTSGHNEFTINEEEDEPLKIWSITIWCSDSSLAPESVTFDGTTHKCTIVWPSGHSTEQCTICVEEVVTSGSI